MTSDGLSYVERTPEEERRAFSLDREQTRAAAQGMTVLRATVIREAINRFGDACFIFGELDYSADLGTFGKLFQECEDAETALLELLGIVEKPNE